MRLAMKPYSSRASRTGVLPIARAKSMARMIASSAVCGPGTTSTSAMSSAGLKKWMLRKRSGRVTASISSDEGRVDEFVPMMVASSACSQIRAYTSRLTSRSSATDSMIVAAPATALKSEPGVTRASAASHAPASSLPFSTRRRSSPAADAVAARRRSSLREIKRT
jgi:hypothetical protein